MAQLRNISPTRFTLLGILLDSFFPPEILSLGARLHQLQMKAVKDA